MFDLCVKCANVRFPAAPATMLSACDNALGAEPRPLKAVHVDFDMAPPSERGGMSGSRPSALQQCMGKRCSHLELHQDHQTQEALERFDHKVFRKQKVLKYTLQ